MTRPEQGALLSILGEGNLAISLSEDTAGQYSSDSVLLSKNQKWIHVCFYGRNKENFYFSRRSFALELSITMC